MYVIQFYAHTKNKECSITKMTGSTKITTRDVKKENYAPSDYMKVYYAK